MCLDYLCLHIQFKAENRTPARYTFSIKPKRGMQSSLLLPLWVAIARRNVVRNYALG